MMAISPLINRPTPYTWPYFNPYSFGKNAMKSNTSLYWGEIVNSGNAKQQTKTHKFEHATRFLTRYVSFFDCVKMNVCNYPYLFICLLLLCYFEKNRDYNRGFIGGNTGKTLENGGSHEN